MPRPAPPRPACLPRSPAEDAEEGRLRITSSTVYNTVMLFMLREADGIFRRLLGLPAHGPAADPQQQPKQQHGGKGKKQADVAKNPRWRKVGPLVKSFWGNSIHLLGSVTDPALLAFTLRRLRASVSLLAPFPRLRDRFVRACLGVFGGGEVAPRLQAFLALRAAAVELPAPALDNVLKVGRRGAGVGAGVGWCPVWIGLLQVGGQRAGADLNVLVAEWGTGALI